MKKIILGTIVVLVILIGYTFYQYQTDRSDRISTPDVYYQGLKQKCNLKENKDCCIESVKRMKSDGATVIDSDTGVCNYGYEREMLNCADSFAWCKSLTVNETSKANFYQSLKDKCKTNDFKKCCLDSVKAMEVVDATKLLLDGKESCGKGLEPMALRCPGSYTWCQTLNNPEGDDFVPVPIDTPRIEPNQPENPGPGFDSDGNGPICTMEAKQCPDGTYVGRTGPNCEFEKCPNNNKDNPIKLPNNIITEKECVAKGGKVWNTLGETSYDGKLIGKIEGLKCLCACLVK